MNRQVPPPALKGLVEETLGLLAPYRPQARASGPAVPMESLLARCRAEAERIEAAAPEPVRLVRHWPGGGGALARALAAVQPGIVDLGAPDPGAAFAGAGVRPLSPVRAEAAFRAGLEALHAGARLDGQRLLLADASAPTAAAPRGRITALLDGRLPLARVLVVRHPLDSWLSVAARGKGKAGDPVAALAAHAGAAAALVAAEGAGTAIVAYEDLATLPETPLDSAGGESPLARLLEALRLPGDPGWRDLLPLLPATGGRAGPGPTPLPRRPLPKRLARALRDPETSDPGRALEPYRALCADLGYDPDPGALARPRSGALARPGPRPPARPGSGSGTAGPASGEAASRRLIVVATVPRSGSTWLFNAVRLLLEEADGPVHAAWIEDYRPNDPAPVHLVKLHQRAEWDGLVGRRQPDLVLTTRRAPEDCLASLIRMGWLENDPEAIRRAWVHQAWLQAHWEVESGLLIPYAQIEADPAGTIARLAQALDLPADLETASRLAARIAALKTPRGTRPDPVTLLHPGHRRPAADRGPGPAEIRRIIEGRAAHPEATGA